MKRLIVILIVLTLSGCGPSTKTAKMLRDSTDRVHTLCDERDNRELFDYLSTRMSACYLGKNMDTPIQAGNPYRFQSIQTQLEALYREGGTSELSVSRLDGRTIKEYNTHVEISMTASCASQVDVYVLNAHWEKRAEHIKDWLAGNMVECM